MCKLEIMLVHIQFGWSGSDAFVNKKSKILRSEKYNKKKFNTLGIWKKIKQKTTCYSAK